MPWLLDRILSEYFLPWTHQIVLAYKGQNETENDIFLPKDTKLSKGYYMKIANLAVISFETGGRKGRAAAARAAVNPNLLTWCDLKVHYLIASGVAMAGGYRNGSR